MIEAILHFFGICSDAHSHISLSDLIVSIYNSDAISFQKEIIRNFFKKNIGAFLNT